MRGRSTSQEECCVGMGMQETEREREREREREIDSIISYRSGGNNRIFALLQSPNKHWGGPGGRGVSQTPHALQKIEI